MLPCLPCVGLWSLARVCPHTLRVPGSWGPRTPTELGGGEPPPCLAPCPLQLRTFSKKKRPQGTKLRSSTHRAQYQLSLHQPRG